MNENFGFVRATGRIIDLIQLLQRHPGLKVGGILQELRISAATFYRLKNDAVSLGVEILHDDGYRVADYGLIDSVKLARRKK